MRVIDWKRSCHAAVVGLLVGIAAGCGGDGGSGSTEESAPDTEPGQTTPAEEAPDLASMHPIGLPNPYQPGIRNWGEAPPGREWGRVSGVGLDPDGETIWVAERCGGDVCIGMDVPVVLHYAPDGTLLDSFGGGLIMRPHGMHVDSAGNVWVTDVRSPRPSELEEHPEDADRGHQVIKFSPEGEILLVIGTPGEAGEPPTHLDQPNDVITTPDGDIFVSEGHSSAGPTARISHFRADGSFVGSFGSHGSGPGQFMTPHALAMDSQGRIFVADRGNARVQIFDQEGNFLDEWDQLGRPSDVWISDDDQIFTIDYESGDERNPGFRRGIYIGDASDGTLNAFIPAHEIEGQPLGMAGEGVVMNDAGEIFVGEVVLEGMSKYELR